MLYDPCSDSESNRFSWHGAIEGVLVFSGLVVWLFVSMVVRTNS